MPSHISQFDDVVEAVRKLERGAEHRHFICRQDMKRAKSIMAAMGHRLRERLGAGVIKVNRYEHIIVIRKEG